MNGPRSGARERLRPAPGAARAGWVRWARTLAWVTVVYNLAEGLVSMWFGTADESLALFGFGADSFIEVGSALLVLWRFRRETGAASPGQERRERRASRAIGGLFTLLAASTVLGAGWELATRRHPQTSVPGLAISLVAIAAMFVLWREKRRAAAALGSRAAAGDAACSAACLKLSLALLAGSLLFLVAPALWWADGGAALVLGVMIGREGWEMATASEEDDAPGTPAPCDDER